MSRKTGDISKQFGKDWKVPKGFPLDDESKKEISNIKEKNGNGWFVFVGCYKNYHKDNYKRKKV
jgi:hypothetical protein